MEEFGLPTLGKTKLASCTMLEGQILVNMHTLPPKIGWFNQVCKCSEGVHSSSAVTCIACTPDGLRILSGHQNGNVLVHDLTPGMPPPTLKVLKR